MLLKLQKYALKLRYRKGKHITLADTLSRAYLPEVHACNFAQRLETVDHTDSLAITIDRLQQLEQVSLDDPVMQALRKTILQGWPESKTELTESIHPYFDVRDELTVQDQLVFKGSRLVIPASMRKEMIAVVHATRIGIEGCIRRARETMFWPRMATEIKEYIVKCDVCMAHHNSPGKEPINQHEFAARPWAKVGADLCDMQGRTLLVVSDYYSNFIEVENITRANTSGISKALKAMFSRYGVPDVLISDNGPQFSSEEFSIFARKWGFEHVTSSPHYPQSNGKAENAVKTVKRLFSKCRESGQSEFLALMDWRNTPTEGMSTSPAQRFLGRRCKTLLPITGSLLQPRYPTEQDAQEINKQKQRQQHYYDRHTKPLRLIATGKAIRMRLPGQRTWSPGVCTGLVGPRSYRVKVGEKVFVRNRRQLICSDKQLLPVPDVDQSLPDSNTEPESIPSDPVEQRSQQNSPPESAAPSTVATPNTTVSPSPTGPRRSSRNRRPPDWVTNYVPS